ncbi:MAG TPA: sigma-70 family RNA polymerase sigma factor [Gemmatimonadaceae bacterium]|nr:sigma-70 family RNA polymerase sigma factor [Gemmatimonadaceae bacterium]
MSSADGDLIARIRDGDETAMTDLYDRHADLLLALAYRVLGDRADAEDVVLEVLERAWRDASRFDERRGSVRAWLVTMVRSRALDTLRARGRQVRLAESAARGGVDAGADEPMTGDDPAARAEWGDDRRVVTAALRELPPAQREAIELAYYGGLSQSEIAARLGAPLGTVKTRIRDGMQKLRVALHPLYVERRA